MQAGHYSSLLPDLFRHKNTKVRLFQPQVILLDFHGTISERRWEDKVIFPYVKRSICQFVKDNFSTDQVQKCLPGLKNESFEQRFRNKYEDAPIIEDQTESMWDREDDHHHQQQLADQVGEFLLWQMQTKRETRETQIIERLVWQDGFRRHLICLPIYDDVMNCLQQWHEKYQINLYIISSIDSDTLKLLFENTNKGNLHQYIGGYVCSKKAGDKLISDTYKHFYERTIVSSRQLDGKSSKITNNCSSSSNVTPSISLLTGSSNSSNNININKNSCTSNDNSKCPKSPGSPGSSSFCSETGGQAKPILFLTDSGQEAKAACVAADGLAYDCILVNRPGNKRIRTYYLSHFQYIEKFDDIEFVRQQ